MIDIKKIYRLSFSKAAKTYEKQAVIQRKTAGIISDKVRSLEGLGLDCGCGTCFINDFLPQKRIINLDISETMAKVCQRKGHQVVVGDIENIPFKDGSFDYVVSNFTLHWTDLSKSFAQINRVLKTDGVFVFSIPVKGSLTAIEEITGKSFFDFEDTHSVYHKSKSFFYTTDVAVYDFEEEMENGISFLKHLHLTGSMVNPKEISMKEKLDIVKRFSQHKQPLKLNFKVAVFECKKP